jgi:hypothetical protein
MTCDCCVSNPDPGEGKIRKKIRKERYEGVTVLLPGQVIGK